MNIDTNLNKYGQKKSNVTHTLCFKTVVKGVAILNIQYSTMYFRLQRTCYGVLIDENPGKNFLMEKVIQKLS